METLSEALRISLNIIFYNRWLSEEETKEVRSPTGNISYVTLLEPTLQERIANLLEAVESELKSEGQTEVSLNFFEKIEKKFLFSAEPKNLWEVWKFKLLASSKTESQAEKEKKLRSYLINIIEKVGL